MNLTKLKTLNEEIMKHKVIYIGNFCISKMDAQSQLILSNSCILQEMGYEVVLIGNDNSLCHSLSPMENVINISGFDCYNLMFRKNLLGLLHSRDLFMQTCQVLEYIGPDSIAAIFCYCSVGFSCQMAWLCKWCHKRGIKVIDNCADLPIQAHGSLPERIVKRIDRLYMNWIIAHRMDGLIAVSRYIENYFLQKRNYSTLILPPLKDTQDLCLYQGNSEIRKIVYVGIPFPIDGRKVDESSYKDRIDLFIDLFCSVKDSLPETYLDIYGLTRDQYLSVVTRQKDLITTNSNVIRFHGRIDHYGAVRAVSEADYSLVYRLRNRMTMAGFSTKFVESISCGTPVLMTDTSEYERYVELGKFCIMLDPTDMDQQQKALCKALKRSRGEINAIKKQCFEKRIFDYRNYIPQMKAFLGKVLTR